jgi:hypothetical protein
MLVLVRVRVRLRFALKKKGKGGRAEEGRDQDENRLRGPVAIVTSRSALPLFFLFCSSSACAGLVAYKSWDLATSPTSEINM